MNLFEQGFLRDYGEISDQKKYSLFTKHMIKDAQDWLSNQLSALSKELSWSTVRQHFLNGFASSTLPPAVETADLKK